MKAVLSFARNTALANILFDEFFAEHPLIEVVAFNYDGSGSALCHCGDRLVEIEKANLHKIIFGVDKTVLETYLTSIFDPEMENETLHRRHGDPFFRLPELQAMKKYDVANLAKKTLKEIQAQTIKSFRYYTRNDATSTASGGQQPDCSC